MRARRCADHPHAVSRGPARHDVPSNGGSVLVAASPLKQSVVELEDGGEQQGACVGVGVRGELDEVVVELVGHAAVGGAAVLRVRRVRFLDVQSKGYMVIWVTWVI